MVVGNAGSRVKISGKYMFKPCYNLFIPCLPAKKNNFLMHRIKMYCLILTGSHCHHSLLGNILPTATIVTWLVTSHSLQINKTNFWLLTGIPQDKISELHGNVFQEKCEKCNRRYDRSYYTMDDIGSQYFEEMDDFGKTDVQKPKFAIKCKTCGLSHRTGRKCDDKVRILYNVV